ncbi:MAG: hypothetical protein HZC05_02840 [Candidatus Magasanikbacteria bacterium]|nr:hypothetical protein [Candidatus Magasanikbacteria bacterium]
MSGLFLIIDITDFDKLTMVVRREDKLKKRIWLKSPKRHLNILACLNKLIKQAKIELRDLSGLVLLEGGGSFSNTRQAAAILNTICLVEKIPVLGLDKRKYGDDWPKIIQAMEKYFRAPNKEKFIKPIYNSEPNITCPII